MPGPHQGAGLRVLVHNQEDTSRVTEEGLTLPKRSHTLIALKPTLVSVFTSRPDNRQDTILVKIPRAQNFQTVQINVNYYRAPHG